MAGSTDLVVVTDAAHHQHDPPFELNAGQRIAPVFERPARLEAIATAVRAAGFPPRPAMPQDDRLITAVHDPGMVEFLRDGHAAWVAAGGPEVLIPDTFRSPRWARGGRPTASPLGRAGWYVTDTATPIVAGSWAATRAAVDVTGTAVEAVLAGHGAAYALTRPPGHHAGPDYLGGFCLLNLAAIAAMRLRTHGRVAIVDVDVHHGNGTQDVFWTDPEVLYVSVHTDPDHQYPYLSGTAQELGEGAGQGTTRNLPLAPGTADDGILHAVEVAGELVTAFEPSSVVVSLGLDMAAADPLGQLALSQAGFARLGALLAALDRPTVLVQEGGYALEAIGPAAVSVLEAFRGRLSGG